MSPYPDVHIVVPTRGERPELLDISMQSLLRQSHPIRITMVAPADALAALSTAYEGTSAVTVIAERGAGLSAAINQAWEDDGWASDYIGWLGDDDALPPSSVHDAVSVLREQADAVMVHGRCLVIDSAGNPLWVVRSGRLAARLAGYGMNLIAQPGCLFRTAAVQVVGGLDPTLRYAMDVDLYARLRKVGPVATTNRQLGVFRSHTLGLSTGQKDEAAAEARRAQRGLHHGFRDRIIDTLALFATRMTEPLNRRLPPAAATYWRPDPA